MLTNRQKLILKAIVEEYVRTAKPVGSKTLILRPEFELNCSSATIRNDMTVLEELGYLQKTHTSSGRVPSEEGYKFYVSQIINDESLKNAVYEVDSFPEVDEIIERNMLSREQAVLESMQLVSDLTNYASVVMGPSAYNAKIRKLQFVSITEKYAVILMVTDKGNVESKKIVIPETISSSEIEKVVSFLNEILYDCPINMITEKIKEQMQESYVRDFINYYDELIAAFVRTFTSMAKDDFHMSGQNSMLSLPEYQDLDKVQELMTAIEKDNIVKAIINSADKNSLTVRIGKDNTVSAMKDCSIITVPYETRDGEIGTLAVLGPTRMEYQKIIPLLEYIAKNIKKIN